MKLGLKEPFDRNQPCVTLQITEFNCGGLSIAAKIAHVLADAHSLSLLVHDWSATITAMVLNEQLPALNPIFDPLLLDTAAAGDLKQPNPNLNLRERARKMPCHRYDWWAPV